MSARAFMQRCEEVIYVRKLGRMAHRRMLVGQGIMGEITIRQRQANSEVDLSVIFGGR